MSNLTIRIQRRPFTNHNGKQCEYNIMLDNTCVHYFSTVDDSCDVTSMAVKADNFVQDLKRTLNFYIAVDVVRDYTQV